MASSAALTQADPPTPAALERLDNVPLELGVRVAAERAVHALLQDLLPSDLVILSQLRGCASLPLVSPAQGNRTLVMPPSATQALPVTAALLAWERERPGPALTCLTAVLVNAALGPEGNDVVQRRRVADLARTVRNALEKRNAPLRILISGARSIPSLLNSIDKEVDADSQIHVSFNQLWKGWLRDSIARWIMEDPGRLRAALGTPQLLTPDLDAPELPLWGEPASGDDQVELAATEISGAEFDGLGIRSTHTLATAHHLLRRSGESPLPLHPDQLVPEQVVQKVARRALEAGHDALQRGDLACAEARFALALLIATGLREIDLVGLRWGALDSAADAVLLPDIPALSLRIRRPSNGVVPPPSMQPLLKRSLERLHWPIPTLVHAGLRRLHGAVGPTHGARVLPFALQGEYRLRSVVTELIPELQLGAGPFRLVLAAAITDRFGPDIAQLALRDSFSTSLGPAYYGAVPEAAIAKLVSELQERWFGEHVPLPPARDGYIGSRLLLKDPAAREWPTELRRARSAAARTNDPFALLKAERDLLAGALCAATGVRPGKCLGRLMLDSVVPEYGLVILEDKVVDVLRRTRVAATGRRWTTQLRRYLDHLVELMEHQDRWVSTWASAVLRSQAPLMSLPAEGGYASLDMRAMLETMPGPLGEVANHYRHRLSQRLLEMGVDWELRHAQLGWVVTPSYALSDSSPLSAEAFGSRLADTIDELLVTDGWYPPTQRITPWSWCEIPERPIPHWAAEVEDYEREHATHIREVRADLNSRRIDVEARVMPRLEAAIAELVPTLRLDLESRSLVLRPGTRAPARLTMEHYLLLRDRIRRETADPAWALEALAAEHLIHEVVRRAIRARIVSGPEPPRRHLRVTTELSPFLPGLGLAVRHAMALRARLSELAAQDRPHDRAGVAQLSVLALTPYRSLEQAAAAMAAASEAVRASTRRALVCVPAVRERAETPLVLAGPSALLLGRRGIEAPAGRALRRDQLATWIEKRFQDVCERHDHAPGLLEGMVATLRMAGRLELAGPERLVMEGHDVASVTTVRSIALSDDWPVRTADVVEVETPGRVREPGPPQSNLPGRPDRRDYHALTAALNQNVARRRGEGRSDGKRAWRSNLKVTLGRLAAEAASGSNLRLLIDYSSHRLKHGGRRVAALSQGSLHKEITRFGGALLDVLGQRALLSMPSDEGQAVYLAVLCGKAPGTRADVLEEIERFHRFLEDVHHAAPVDFAPLRSFSGPRVRSLAPGSVSDPEVHAVLKELQLDLAKEDARHDAAPQEVRACSLRILSFLLLEASGARPSSIHGLVLGDLHLFGLGNDYVHVHRTGEFGEAKTLASVGFIPLEGSVWAAWRGWVLKWLNQERKRFGPSWFKHPLFADAVGSKRRFERAYLARRTGDLLRWATGEPGARVYWLRKRRITSRLAAALGGPAACPRTVYRALRDSGHVRVETTLGSYVFDASVPVQPSLNVASLPDRQAALVTSRLTPGVLDQAWHRTRRLKRNDFYGVILDRVGVPIAEAPAELMTSAPEMWRQKRLTPRHIDQFARQRQLYRDPLEAMAHSGLTSTQVEILDQAAADLLVRTGSAPWRVEGVRQSRGVMPPARRLANTDRLFALMEAAPGDWLRLLIDSWTHQGYVHRLHGDEVVLVLRTGDEVRAAQHLLDSTGAALRIAPSGADHALCTGDPSGGATSTHASALRWVFAMHWMYLRLAA